MKKLSFFIIGLICIGFQIHAQDLPPQLPNCDFENWVNNTTPQSWATHINGEIVTYVFGIPIPYPVSVSYGSRTTDAHGGSYALKVKPANFSIPLLGLNYDLPAICQLGTVGFFSVPIETIMDIIELLTNFDFQNFDPSILEDLAVLQVLLSKGVPYPLLPSELSAWVKFVPAPESGDFAALLVYATNWNTELNTREYVGFGFSMFDETISDYTEVKIPIDTLLSITACDSISVIMLVGGQNTSTSTDFLIDDITISVYEEEDDDDDDKITILASLNFNIYSSENYITIEPKENDEYYDVQIFDLSGKVFFEKNNNLGKQTILSTHFQKGICFVQIKGKNLRSFSTQMLIK